MPVRLLYRGVGRRQTVRRLWILAVSLYDCALRPPAGPIPMSDMITFDRLGKTYGDFAAVRDLELGIARGEVFGFLGPNGAGKTTTIRMMMGILVPTSGRATIDGLDCQTEQIGRASCRERVETSRGA